MPGTKDNNTAYKITKYKHPRPRPNEYGAPSTAARSRRSPGCQPKAGHHPPSCCERPTGTNTAKAELLRRLEDPVCTPLYYTALRPDSLPAQLQKPRLQLDLEQLPFLTRYYQWYARRSIRIPTGYSKCICGHAEEEAWDHFKMCSWYRELDTLMDWNPTKTIAEKSRMVDAVPDNPKPRHHPQRDGGTRGSPQRAHLHCRLHPAKDLRGQPPGHSSTHATDCRCQDSRTTHITHLQIPAPCSHPAPGGPDPAPQTAVLPTVRPHPATYHPTRDPPLARTPSTKHDTDTGQSRILTKTFSKGSFTRGVLPDFTRRGTNYLHTTLLKAYPKSLCFCFSAPKIGGVLTKTFSKGSFTCFF